MTCADSLWLVFQVYVSGTRDKMRGNGLVGNLFLCDPTLIGFLRLAGAQDVMGLLVQVWHLFPPVSPQPYFSFFFFNPQNTLL